MEFSLLGYRANFGLANTIVQETGAGSVARAEFSAVFGLSFFGLMPNRRSAYQPVLFRF